MISIIDGNTQKGHKQGGCERAREWEERGIVAKCTECVIMKGRAARWTEVREGGKGPQTKARDDGNVKGKQHEASTRSRVSKVARRRQGCAGPSCYR